MSIRFRGSILGSYTEPTASAASGIYDLDAYSTFASLNAWPAAVAGSYRTPTQAIFGLGMTASSPYYTGVTNIVSSTGVIASDTAAVATARSSGAAAGYGFDKAVFSGGFDNSGGASTSQAIVNLVTNTGTVGANQTNTGPKYSDHTGATYGFDKAVFSYGTNWVTGVSNQVWNFCTLMSNTGVFSSTNTITPNYHINGVAVGYGNDTALIVTGFGTNSAGVGSYSQVHYSYISNTGVLSTETATANSTDIGRAGQRATRYGNGTAIITAFQNATGQLIAYVTDTGVLGSDQSITMSRRISYACTTYSGGNAIGAFGTDNTNLLTTQFLISNTGVVAADSTGAGTARQGVAAAGFSLA